MAAFTITDIININNKAAAATDKYLSGHPSIALNGKAFTPAELKAALQADSSTLVVAEEARLRYRRLVAESRAARKEALAMHRALKSYLTLLFGPSAVDVLGEFGFTPKPTPTRSAVTTVLAIAKAKATRLARHTMGKKQRLAIKAPVQPAAPTDPVVLTGH